jgi:hypothetical protein
MKNGAILKMCLLNENDSISVFTEKKSYNQLFGLMLSLFERNYSSAPQVVISIQEKSRDPSHSFGMTKAQICGCAMHHTGGASHVPRECGHLETKYVSSE